MHEGHLMNGLPSAEALCLFKLKHDIRVESKIRLAQLEVERCIGAEAKSVASMPALVKTFPFSELDDQVIHRIMRLAYLGSVQGFMVRTLDPRVLRTIVRRSTYFREIYAVVKLDEQGLGRIVEGIHMAAPERADTRVLGEFINLGPNIQLFNQRLKDGLLLSTFFLIPDQVLLEYGSEVLKLPHVTFTKQFTDLDERIDHMESGAERGIDELLDHLKMGFRRMPWLGLYKEHIGDYVDWAFSGFRTWGLHFIHKHEGKADPWLARSALNLLGVDDGGRVLDPFCGSGTFIADAPLMGLDAYGVDINPLSTMVAKVKCGFTEMPIEELRGTILAVHKVISASDPPPCPELGPLLRESGASDRRRLQVNAKSVGHIMWFKHIVDDITDDKDELVRDFLYTMLSRSIIDLMEKGKLDVLDSFLTDSVHFYLSAYVGQAILRRLGLDAKGKCTILTADAKGIRGLLGGVDGVVTSPPYFDALDYVQFTKAPLHLLGMDDGRLKLGETTIGSREGPVKNSDLEGLPESSKVLVSELAGHGRTKKAVIVLRYLLDMKACLSGLRDVLKEGGRIIFVVGRYHRWKFGSRSVRVDGAQVLIDLGEHVGLTLEGELLHDISKIEAGSRIRQESIIMWRKGLVRSDHVRSRDIIAFSDE